MKGVKIMKKRTLLRTMVGISLVAFLTLAFAIPGAQAQAKFPSRPMTIICPYGAGGGTDAVARIIASLMEQDLGQPVNVVNRTGGGGAVGNTAGATADPDGYTMTMVAPDLVMNHWLGLVKVNYRDIRGVALMNFDPSAINVRADAPWKTVFELQEYVKANPGKLKASGTGKGGVWDLARAGWLMKAGIPVDAIVWVPSTGAAAALQELMPRFTWARSSPHWCRRCSSGADGRRLPRNTLQFAGSPRFDRSEESENTCYYGRESCETFPGCTDLERIGYGLVGRCLARDRGSQGNSG